MSGRALLQDLIVGVAKRANISEQEAETFVRMVFTIISDSLADEKIIKIRNLGTFKLVEIDDRESVDPNTGALTRVKGYKKIVFTPDNALKDLINKPFAQFETVILNDNTDLSEMERGAESSFLSDEEEEDEALAMEESSEELPEENTLMDEESQEEISDTTSLEENETAVLNETVKSDSEKSEEDSDAETTEDDVADGLAEDERGVVNASSDEENVQPESDVDTEFPHSENDVASSNNIEYQHADYQKIQEQKVEELNVTTQTIEHQTIEHQSIVHQGKEENGHQNRSMRLSLGGMIALFVFILVLMAGSYLAGYYRVLCPCTFLPEAENYSGTLVLTGEDDSVSAVCPIPKSEQHTPADTVAEKRMNQSAKEVTAPASEQTQASKETVAKSKEDSLAQLRKKAAQYPQVKNGSYLIVGVKSSHTLRSGESLLRLAQKNYGSRDFVQYIVTLNQIKDPDLVQIGKEIKLPELIKK